MRTFIKLKTLLGKIPKVLFEESPESEFYDSMLDGLNLLPSVVGYEPQMELLEIVDGKVQLPKHVKRINHVSYQETDPTDECISNLQTTCGCTDESSDLNPDICRPAITYKQWLDSPYYKQNYKTLKYIGTDKSMLSNNSACHSSRCSETFVITPTKTMYFSLDCGFICVEYEAPVCDEKGDLLIPDHGILHEFLISFAIYKHWENRQFTKEEQSGNFYQAYSQKQALLLRQAKGDHLLRNFNVANINDILGGTYKKLIQIPEILFYAR